MYFQFYKYTILDSTAFLLYFMLLSFDFSFLHEE